MLQLTTASIQDIDVIISLANTIWPQTYYSIVGKEQVDYMLQQFYNKEILHAQMKDVKHTFFLLHNNNDTIGYAHIIQQENNCFKLSKIYINTELQGKGYGKFFINEIEQQVKNKKGTAIELNVNRYNKAKDYYIKMGYKIIQEIDIPLHIYWLNDFIMYKTLE